MTNTQTANLLGGMLNGRYHIIKLLGKGGMAQVYLAIDQKTEKYVAVKVMHDDLSNDPMSINLFKTEAKATSSLNHPNIIKTIGFGHDHEHRYIVQEYAEGGSLKELINKNGAIPWQKAVPMAIQIGLALEHTHAHGLVHRDIKPQNILITKERIAKVTDFGIAQEIKSNKKPLIDQISSGSVHYSSPEQARGMTVDEKSDIYSLGILMYEMVTGHVPFDSDTTVAISIMHIQDVATSPSLINNTVPRGLDQIIMKCIQKLPENRYQNARELVDELDALLIEPNGVYGVISGISDRDEQTTALQAMSPGPNYFKLREIEQIIIKRRHSRRRDTAIVMTIIMVAVVFMTSIGTWGWSKLSASIQTEPNQSYEISNYVGRELTEVLGILEKDKIQVDIVYSENPTVIVGLITSQTPSSGEVVEKTNAALILTVSSGPDLQIIPDLSGQTSSDAYDELTQTLGYQVRIMTENNQIDQGTVIRTSPAAGEQAPQGGSVILVISNGMPLVTTSDSVSKSFAQKPATTESTTEEITLAPTESTTEETTLATTEPTTQATTAATMKTTTQATTVATTKTTTQATTAVTTKSTTQATTAATTKPTTEATTAATTKPTTEATTAATTTEPTIEVTTAATTTKPTTEATTAAPATESATTATP